MKLVKIALSICGFCFLSAAVANTSITAQIQSLSPQISTWAEQSVVVNYVQKINAQHSNYSKSQIRALNKQWQQQLNSSDKPLISGVMNNELSELLEKIQEHSNGLYQGILITDTKGLNIGETFISNEYWQGGQRFWKKAFATSPAKPYIFQGSNKKGQLKPAMIALPILDSQGRPIGVVAVNIDTSKLGQSAS
jgi:sensor histidine kinase regulating citrate/malate metabolism